MLALLFALCSCVNMEFGIVINEDGSARAYAEVAVQKSLLDMVDMTEEDFFEQVDESTGSSTKDWQTEKYSETIGGDTYTGVRYYKDGSLDVFAREGVAANYSIFGRVRDSLDISDREEIANGNDDGEKISFERNGSTLLVTIVYEGDAAEPSDEMDDYLSQNMMNVTFRVKAPFPVLETNGTIDEDGSVYWSMLDVMTGKTDRLEMTVSYDAGIDPGMILWIVIGALVVIVVVVVVIVLLRKKPKPLAQAQTDSYAQSYIPTETAAPSMGVSDTGAPSASSAPATVPTEPAQSEEPTAPEAENRKFCTNCGEQVKADDTFCPSCGGKIQ